MTATKAHDLLLVVAAALVDPDGRVLIAQRPEGKSMAGLWEFPGGKVETGETPEAALIRELQEELGITVKEPCLAPFTFASHTYGAFHLLMPLYVCRRWDGNPQAADACGAEMGAAPGSARQRGRLSHARRRLAAYSHAARSVVRGFAADTGGATSIEYTLVAMLIAVVIVAALTNIGTRSTA